MSHPRKRAPASTTAASIEAAVVRTEVRFEGYRQSRAARIYAPASDGAKARSGAAPVLLFLHGGGFVAGGLDCSDALARDLASRLRVDVVAADYTPAREGAFPTAVEDAYAALVWIRAQSTRRKWDLRRIAVCGEEAGGNLAAAVAMMARDRGGPALVAQVLVTPMLDPSLSSPSMRDSKPERERRSPGVCAACYRAYLPNAADRMHPYAAPAHATRLRDLAPALILTAVDDPLHAEAETYGARLIAAGVKTQVARQPVIAAGASVECAWSDAMWSEIVAFLRPLLALPDYQSCPSVIAMNGYSEFAALRSRRPLRVAAAIVLLAVTGALAACRKDDHAAPPGPPPGPPSVSVAPALEKEIAESEEFSGRIEAVEQVEVRARVNGYIQSVNFKQGQEVKKGDLLYQIDPRPFQAAVRGEEAALATVRAQQELAKTERARAELMWEDRATSKREYDEKVSRVRELEAQARAAQAALERARLNLAYTRIVAPIAGRVSKAEITAGNLVQGEVPNSPVLTTLVSSNPIYAAFETDERTYLQYGLKARGKVALPVHVGLATEEGFPHEGRLDFVDNRVDPTTGTVRMRAILENPDGLLTPGLFARIKLADSTRSAPAVLVSDRAIGTDQDKKFVYVVNGENKAQYRQVKLGPIVDGLRVVRDGLKPGELIVVNGLQRVRPGAPVAPEQVPMEAEQKTPAASRFQQTATLEAPRAT